MTMSPRHEVAQGLAETCIFGNLGVVLNDGEGGLIAKGEENGKSFWSVGFSKPKLVDGSIKVYGPSFILLKWEGKMGNGSQVFRSEHEAKSFLQSKFIQPKEVL